MAHNDLPRDCHIQPVNGRAVPNGALNVQNGPKPRERPSWMKRRSPRLIAATAALVYLAFGVVWIMGSDAVVEGMAGTTEELSRLQTWKGWAYVGFTALIAYAIVRALLWGDARLRRSRRQLAETLRHAPVGIALLDGQQHWLSANPELQRILGLATLSRSRTLGDSLGLDARKIDRAAREPITFWHSPPGATPRWLRLRVAALPGDELVTGEAEDAPAQLALVEDISLQREHEERLRLAAAAFESRQPTLITDAGGTIVRVNQAFLALSGYTAEELLGQNPRILASGRQDRRFYEELWRALVEEGYWEGELLNRRRDGSVIPQWQRITAVRDEAGFTTHYVAHVVDLSERRSIEATLHRLENYDPLTGLPNRSHFLQRIEAVLASQDSAQGKLLLLDIDAFRSINDALGPARGDAILREVAALLGEAHPQENLARVSADVFAILLPPDEGAIDAELERLRAGLPGLPTVAAAGYPITACLGASVIAADEVDPAAQLARAEAALHHAKQAGPGSFSRFDPGMQSAAEAHLAQATRLRRALASGEIRAWLQPQCDDDGRIVAAEALARWVRSDGSIVSPGEFIPLAEELGLISRIGEQMLSQAARLSARLAESGRPIILAVNLSAQHMHEPDFVARTLQIVREAGADPRLITLEVTESLVIDDYGTAAARLDTLRDHGFRIAIDDFGTGYSSLSYLRHLPIDELKIDGSFLRDAVADRRGELLFESVVAIGHTLGLLVVAEGVETAEQAALARRSGRVLLQGYLLGRPMAEHDFLARLEGSA